MDGRCTVCGTLAPADEPDAFASTMKRAALSVDAPPLPPPPAPDELGMTQPNIAALRLAPSDVDLSDTHARVAVPRHLDTELAPTAPKLPAAQPVTTDTGETKALIEKSIVGTQWIMVAILIGVPLGFLTQIIMARIDPTALGIYNLMIVLVTAVQTFFLFGGE